MPGQSLGFPWKLWGLTVQTISDFDILSVS